MHFLPYFWLQRLWKHFQEQNGCHSLGRCREVLFIYNFIFVIYDVDFRAELYFRHTSAVNICEKCL